jgi:RNase adaptor protein for sRNA GlmZ degradation
MDMIEGRSKLYDATDDSIAWLISILTIAYAEDSDDRSPKLRVGCFCELGRHRSVAFVEELAHRKWPSDWEVEICHRDVDQSKSKNKNQHHKQSRRDNQKFVGSGIEQ